MKKFTIGKNKVSFLSEKDKISGNLFLPKNYSQEKTYEAIVVVTPASGIKEQTAGIYAEKLASKGFITLAFDHRTYGESEGLPRGMENAPMKVEDIKNAISFIKTIPGVKGEISLLGICSGSGYSLQAAMFDGRVKRIAIVSAFIDFIDYGLSGATQYANELSGDKYNQFAQQMKMASDARQAYFETGEVKQCWGIPPRSENLGEFWGRAADYYLNPKRGGQYPTYSNMRATISLDTRYFFNPTEHMDLLKNKPFLIIVGEESMSFQISQIAYDKALGEKELVIVKKATHFDLYDQDEYVDQAIEKLTSFYK